VSFGAEESRQVLRGRSDRQLVTIGQVDDHGTHGALFVTETVSFDTEIATIERALRYRAAADRLVECWLYDHDQHLVDQAWSPGRSPGVSACAQPQPPGAAPPESSPNSVSHEIE
jgi:hypothetical protein